MTVSIAFRFWFSFLAFAIATAQLVNGWGPPWWFHVVCLCGIVPGLLSAASRYLRFE